jgi:hypothetical protein
MIKSSYISPMRSNAMIDETMTGRTIVVDGMTYAEVSRPPRGKRIIRKFTNLEGTEKIRVYH